MTAIPVDLYPDIHPDLNVAEIDVVEGAAGPGRRLVVWLQGCLKRCPGCANGPFLSAKSSRVLTVEELLQAIDAGKDLAGVTLSGGEPALQAAALLPFLRQVHARGQNVVCYSGYRLEQLQAPDVDPVLGDFLAEVDLLIDGEYRRELPRRGVYRPSGNQRLHFLSALIPPESCATVSETVVSLGSGRAVTTGTLPTAIRERLFEKLSARGVVVSRLT